MSSQINPASIDATFPVAGVNQPTQGFRNNFLATKNQFTETAAEINDLINKVIVSAPLTYGSNANINNFGGMPISNVGLSDFGFKTKNYGTIAGAVTETLDFTQGFYNLMDVEISGASTLNAVSINTANFPNLGYSELVVDAKTTSAPQYINFTPLRSSGSIYADTSISGYSNTSNCFTLSTNSTRYKITLGSTDGTNWLLSAKSFHI